MLAAIRYSAILRAAFSGAFARTAKSIAPRAARDRVPFVFTPIHLLLLPLPLRLRSFAAERPGLVVQQQFLFPLRRWHSIYFEIFEKMHAGLACGRKVDVAIAVQITNKKLG